jgi:ubiquinone/menaquinone biosynthesis C-methylase UbiE
MDIRNSMGRWVWLCPFGMLGLAVGILMLFGLSVWTSVVVAILLVCPVIMMWGVLKVMSRPKEFPLEPVPETRGMTLNWAAPFYDRWCPMIGLGRSFRVETLRHAALQSGERVLEVGCGTGVLTRLAAEAVGPTGRAIGIDPAFRMIALARENAARMGSQADFRLAAIENLPFNNESFDGVLASLMIHHLPPDVKRAGLREVYRVLRPGGRLVVADFDCSHAHLFWKLLSWPLRMMPMLRDHAAGRLDAYFVEAGFYPVPAVGSWGGMLSFWMAQKPKEG